MGNKKITNNFIICKYLMQPVIIGRDFTYKNDMKISYYRSGHMKIEFKKEELIASIDEVTYPSLSLKGSFFIPPRSLVVVDVKSGVTSDNIGQLFEVVPDAKLQSDFSELQVLPMLH